jgi:hypothetical protein
MTDPKWKTAEAIAAVRPGEGHDELTTNQFLDKARVNMAGIGAKAYEALQQVARFSEVPEAAALAKEQIQVLVKLEKELEHYLHNKRYASEPRTAGSGMTDDEMHWLANVLKEGPKDRIIAGLIKQWNDLWAAWEAVGRSQASLEKHGVGGTEADTLFKSQLEPKIKRFQETFAKIMGHVSAIANK